MHHIDIILEGLPYEFALVVSVVESKFGLMDLDEVEILLLAHEFSFTKFKKQSPTDLVSLNLTHVGSTGSNIEDNNSSTPGPSPLVVEQHSDTDFHQFRGGRISRGGRPGRGRGGRSSTVQCQVSHEVLLDGAIGTNGLYEFPSINLPSFSPKATTSTVCSNSVFPSVNSTFVRASPTTMWHLSLLYGKVS
ncbi:hypothetical protein KIW84_063414 [Lathyrus oleraceus]|uniref:Uncharacterized protein n=1 Tax=Pisum sativum TaxID=3888 RepID=A0A9D4W9F8_PEA|nr:hypothetical protein KIW84_063414 [Pisum sativum]